MIQQQAAHFALHVDKPWNKHHHDSITEMLKELNWPSLQERRKQACLSCCIKLITCPKMLPAIIKSICY